MRYYYIKNCSRFTKVLNVYKSLPFWRNFLLSCWLSLHTIYHQLSVCNLKPPLFRLWDDPLSHTCNSRKVKLPLMIMMRDATSRNNNYKNWQSKKQSNSYYISDSGKFHTVVAVARIFHFVLIHSRPFLSNSSLTSAYFASLTNSGQHTFLIPTGKFLFQPVPEIKHLKKCTLHFA